MITTYFDIFKKNGFWASVPEELDRLIGPSDYQKVLDVIKQIQIFYKSSSYKKPKDSFVLFTQEIDFFNCNEFLSRVLLTYESVIIQDPIPSFDPDIRHVYEFGPKEGPEKIISRFVHALKWLVRHEKLIKQGIVVLAPDKYFSKFVSAHNSRLLTKDQFLGKGPTDLSMEIDPRLKKIISNYVQVFPLKMTPDGSLTAFFDKFDLAHNIISISFRDDPRYLGHSVYKLFEIDASTMKEDGTVGMYLPILEPGNVEKTKYENWRNDSIYKVALKRINKLEHGLSLSNLMETVYFTESSFEWDALNGLSKGTIDDEAKLAQVMGQLEIPFLENVRLENIVKLRENEESFHNFRQLLKGACKEIEECSSQSIQTKASQIEREVLKPELLKIQADYKAIVNKYLALASIEAAALTLSASTGPISLAAGIVGAAKILPEIMTARRELQRNNIYMLWRMKQSRDRSKRFSNILL